MDSMEFNPIDTELKELNVDDSLRTNNSFMKVAAAIFHYGNQFLTAGQIVNCVRNLDLLPLRGETPKSTIQGIVSHSRKISRNRNLVDPFVVDKDGPLKQTRYRLSDEFIGNAQPPEPRVAPDGTVAIYPVTPYNHLGKRQRKAPEIYTPNEKLRSGRKIKKKPITKKAKVIVIKRPKKQKDTMPAIEPSNEPEIDVDEDLTLEEQMQVPVYRVDEDDDTASFDSMGLGSDYEDLLGMAKETKAATPEPQVVEEDTIANYSLIYTPPTPDQSYIDPINFTEYSIASNFAIVQQKGYSYPRFRSHEKIKIPKIHCEDKFRVSDISKHKRVVGRLFVLADGHGGPGCSEYFVRNTPDAVQAVCSKYISSKLGDPAVQEKLEKDIKSMIQKLDDSYLDIKRQQIAQKDSNTKVDNDGCTLVLNLFLGEWLINVNVGDSRSILITAPEPSTPLPVMAPYTVGIDKDYNFDVEFASQDHKPYLEHLARHILENGGEFVDSVQNRVIKVDVDKLREDGNRHAKRVSLKNARIRPKDYQIYLANRSMSLSKPTTAASNNSNNNTSNNHNSNDQNHNINTSHGCNETIKPEAAGTPPTTVVEGRDRVPSLNVARSCGDLDFKMDPQHKIISCEPDVTFIRICDTRRGFRTTIKNGPNKEKRRHFLFMSTDGTFDYMYEETAERQNKAIAKILGPMIEDGEKIGHYLLDEEDKLKEESIAKKQQPACTANSHHKDLSADVKMEEDDQIDIMDDDADNAAAIRLEGVRSPMNVDSPAPPAQPSPVPSEQERATPVPLLHKELDEEDLRARRIKERTLVYSARYFANREGAHGFFASKLQDYDDCTIILVEI